MQQLLSFARFVWRFWHRFAGGWLGTVIASELLGTDRICWVHIFVVADIQAVYVGPTLRKHHMTGGYQRRNFAHQISRRCA